MTRDDLYKLKAAFGRGIELGRRLEKGEFTDYVVKDLLEFGIEVGVMHGKALRVERYKKAGRSR